MISSYQISQVPELQKGSQSDEYVFLQTCPTSSMLKIISLWIVTKSGGLREKACLICPCLGPKLYIDIYTRAIQLS